MRILSIWITALILMVAISLGWYISLPVVFGMTGGIGQLSLSSPANNIRVLAQYVTVWWGPLLILFILLWAIISSQKVDPTSEYA